MDWAVNKIKLQRAINSAGIGATEHKVFQEYVRLGGAVVGEPTGEVIVEETKVEAKEVEEVKPGLVEETAVVKKTPKKSIFKKK